ncbi:MAG: hypothetical protein ACI8RN_000804 [Glaciecola sp.]|jgi:hypothetical protein|uniref:hypothetical protein n=1 Tax=Congregibacter sp. TaxID=2744308 RepID=UPI0039E611CB
MNQIFRIRSFGPLVAVVCAVLLGACSQERPPVKGFVLPEGNTETGALVFIEMGCPQCHVVADSDITQPQDAALRIQLGGNIHYVKHYGDLLTSIVIPDHRISAQYQPPSADEESMVSPMPAFTETLTVAQLVDLVEFLHSKYTTIPTYAGEFYYYAP